MILDHQHLINKPIPALKSVAGWKNTPISECGEQLELIKDGVDNGLFCWPQYFRLNIQGAIEACYARQQIAERLGQVAQALLPLSLSLVIWDSWRPVQVQQALFEEFRTRLQAEHPEWSEDELLTNTQTYVSLPSTNPSRPSPHLTGGSVDLSLVHEDGSDVYMGTDFDDFSKRASTRYFEEIEIERSLDPTETLARNNRRLLFHVMSSFEFTNYPEEWWHFDFGNQFWATITGRDAIYGPCFV